MSESVGRDIYIKENLLARLDRIPVNRKIIFLVSLLGVIWICEAFDIGIIAPVIFLLKGAWHLKPNDIGLIASAGTLGIVIGLVPAGWVADHLGRKTALLYGIAIFSVATFLASFSQNITQLVVFRFIAGLGQGAVFPAPYLMMSELVNKKWRGTASGIGNGFLAFAYALNTFVAALIVDRITDADAWRLLLAIGGATIFIIPIIIKFLPESPRFLLKKGKIDAVRKLVEELEDISGITHDESLIHAGSLSALERTASRRVSVVDFFRPPYFLRCFVSYTALLSPLLVFYVITIYGPSIIEHMGASKADALYYNTGLQLFTIFTILFGGWISDKISRRWGIAIAIGITALGVIALGQPLPRWGIFVAALVVWGADTAVNPMAKMYMAEQFPTRLRGTGCMVGESIARFLSGVVLVFLFPILGAQLTPSALFTTLGLLAAMCVVPVLLFGFKTSNISIEQTGSDQNDRRQQHEASAVDGRPAGSQG